MPKTTLRNLAVIVLCAASSACETNATLREEDDAGLGAQETDAHLATAARDATGSDAPSTLDASLPERRGWLRGVQSGRCVGALRLADGEPVIAAPCDRRSALQLITIPSEQRVRVLDTDLCVAMQSDTDAPREALLLRTCAAVREQRFTVEESATFAIVNGRGLCADFDPEVADGAPLKQWTCHREPNQLFTWLDAVDAPMPTGEASVQGIFDDMTLPSTYPIAVLVGGRIEELREGGYPSRFGRTIMGHMAHGRASPSWWSPSAGFEWVRGANWSNLVPWLVVLTGTGNRATETRIEMRRFRAMALRRSTGAWVELSAPSAVSGYNCPPGSWDECGLPTDIVIDGTTSSVLPAGTGSNFHGWSTTGGTIADPDDIEVYLATIEARLVGPDAASAQYMLHVGSDFYPAGLTVRELGGYNPGSGFSRSVGLSTTWTRISYATIDGGAVGDSRWVAPRERLRAVPPPGFVP